MVTPLVLPIALTLYPVILVMLLIISVKMTPLECSYMEKEPTKAVMYTNSLATAAYCTCAKPLATGHSKSFITGCLVAVYLPSLHGFPLSVNLVYFPLPTQNSLTFPEEPKTSLEQEAHLLIKALLTDKDERLDYERIRQHPFFAQTDWDHLLEGKSRSLVPPALPRLFSLFTL